LRYIKIKDAEFQSPVVRFLNRVLVVDSCYRNIAFSANLLEWVDLYDLEGKIKFVDPTVRKLAAQLFRREN